MILSTMPDGQPSVIVDYIGVLAVLMFCLCRPCAAEKEKEMPPRENRGGTNVMKASLLVFLFIVLGNVFYYAGGNQIIVSSNVAAVLFILSVLWVYIFMVTLTSACPSLSWAVLGLIPA